MARIELNFDPVTRVTTDAIGKPGERIFYLQGQKETETATLLIEKVQVESLAAGIEQFLEEVAREKPDLPAASGDYAEEQMHISPPVDPLFRVGEIGIGYEQTRDLVVLIVREVLMEGADPEEAGVVRFWCTRSQVLALSRWGVEVCSRGRPICPQCGQPMDPEGHFCPKKNGHKH